MKKIILLIVAVIFTATIFSQTTYVPDDYFEQKLIDLGVDTGPLDDSVTTANISQITTLSFEPYSINDLTVIQDYIALKELNCSRNYNLPKFNY